jgi:translation initiation factor IF-2
VRLFEASKNYNIKRPELVQLFASLGYDLKDHQFTVVTDEMREKLEAHLKSGASGKPAKPPVKPAPQQAEVQQEKKPVLMKPVFTPPPPPPPPSTASQPIEQELSAGAAANKEVKIIPGKEKKLGPKPPRQDEAEEVEVNQQITIIKTTLTKKEGPVKKPKKKKELKKIPKSSHIPKKVLEEQRENEELEALLAAEAAAAASAAGSTEEPIPQITIPQEVTVSELAKYLNINGTDIVKKLLSIGIFASLNQRLEAEQVELIGREFGKEILFSDDVIDLDETPDNPEDLKSIPPVVTIMGHVDHGKTSLLDRIRHAHVADGEVGGITQHIGAYQVKTPNGVITFLDTPGHEAFTAMRAQGAQVTDVAILVVAADDGVQPQTVEAIHHAQAANVPIIVAVNKIDKNDANPERVKQQLMPYNLISEDWGGKTIMVQVSAQEGTNIELLLEMILLQAEMMEIKANPDRPGEGIIIEARLDKGMGPMGTVLIQNGTIRLGDSIICGTTFGRVKALINDSGARVKDAGPACPVAILGLGDVPRVGDKLKVVESAKFARYVSVLRQKKEREERLQREKRLKLIDLFQHVSEGKVKELGIIIKADVQGSAGALKDAFERLSNPEVKINVLHSGVGAVNETDVMLAAASNAIIIGFHVRPAHGVEEIAHREDVEIKVFRIIYDAIDAVKLALKGMYEPEYEEEVLGRAEVRKVFRITGSGAVAGSYVLDGKIQRDATVRLIRDGVEVYEGKLGSLKRFKDDVREVAAGFECGIGLASYNDIKESDIMEFFRLKEIQRD